MSTQPHPCTSLDYVGIGLDWLTATVTAEASEVLATLARATGLEPRTTRPLNGYGYPSAVALYGGDEPELYVMHGPSRNPLVVGPGRHAERAQALLANRFPHRCTASRKDVALDFGDPDYFDVFVAAGVPIALRRGLGVNQMGDWMVPGSPAGRTLYLGSVKSEQLVRVYEYRKKHGHGPAVRVELEYKPKSIDKGWCFAATNMQILGRSAFVVELAKQAGVDLTRAVPRLTSKAPTTLERQVEALVSQYGKLLRDRLLPTLNGDVGAIGPHLLTALESLEEHRRQVASAAAGAHAAEPMDTLTTRGLT